MFLVKVRLALCLLSWLCLSLSGAAQSALARRTPFAALPPFEQAVLVMKHFEGWHSAKHYPYVGYGHRLLPHEYGRLSSKISRRQADSLLRHDLAVRLHVFRKYGKDALLLAVLSYNVGTARLLGSSTLPRSRLIRKLELGNRYILPEYLSYCHYEGRFLPSLLRRRKLEFALFYIPERHATDKHKSRIPHRP